ncbi:MAG: hypothetical protein ABI442_06350 [Gemmatimonadaceae bacterium]
MTHLRAATVALLFAPLLCAARSIGAQTSDSVKQVKFFQSETPLVVTLTTNIGRLRGDKPDKDGNAPWRAASLRYAAVDGAAVTVPVRVRVRGIWRLKNCQFPPIRLNFTSAATKKTIFKGLDKPKLVSFCRDQDAYENYVVQELQLYRVYHLLTPASHAVRLLKMTYVDSASGKTHAVRYAFIEEDPAAMADRLGGKLMKTKGATPDDLEPAHDAVVGLFQYMIGNTDFALSELHNAELFSSAATGEYWPIVYDFDYAGAVNASYATADPSLRLASVRTRLYRGYCVPAETYPGVIALFNAKREAIYHLYRDSIGQLMRPQDVRETLAYFDDFYSTLNSPGDFRSSVVERCLGAKKK